MRGNLSDRAALTLQTRFCLPTPTVVAICVEFVGVLTRSPWAFFWAGYDCSGHRHTEHVAKFVSFKRRRSRGKFYCRTPCFESGPCHTAVVKKECWSELILLVSARFIYCKQYTFYSIYCCIPLFFFTSWMIKGICIHCYSRTSCWQYSNLSDCGLW